VIMILFKERLKELRIEKGLTQTQLAKELRVNQRTISNWEVGERQPTLDTLEVIAKYFNVSYDYLLGLTDE